MIEVIKYQIIKQHKRGEKLFEVGDIVWKLIGHDFGLAADDTAIFGEEYISVTSKTYGIGGSFTIPLSKLIVLGQYNLLPPDKAYIKDVCRPGEQERTCRYLVSSTKGIECAKLTELKYTLDRRVKENKFIARGDNCDGMGTH